MNVQMMHRGPQGGEKQNKAEKRGKKGECNQCAATQLCASVFAWCSHPQWRSCAGFGLAWPFHSPGTFTALQYLSKHLLSPLPVQTPITFSVPAHLYSLCLLLTLLIILTCTLLLNPNILFLVFLFGSTFFLQCKLMVQDLFFFLILWTQGTGGNYIGSEDSICMNMNPLFFNYYQYWLLKCSIHYFTHFFYLSLADMENMWLFSLFQCMLSISVIAVSIRLCMAVSGNSRVADALGRTQGTWTQPRSVSCCLRLCLGWVGAIGGAVGVPVNILLNLRIARCLYTCITLVCCPMLVRHFTMFLLMLLTLDTHLQLRLGDRWVWKTDKSV